MISLFKKQKSEKEIIEEIHNEFDTAPDRILQQALRIIEEQTNAKIVLESGIENKAERLKKIGFIKNGLVAKKVEIAERNTAKDEVINLTNKEAELVKYYKDNYPFIKTLPISELDRICDKYGLIYAPVQNYKMPVPDKNLVEIEDSQSLKNYDNYEGETILRVPQNQQWRHDFPSGLGSILHKGFVVPNSEVDTNFISDERILTLAKKYGNYTGSYTGYLTKPYGDAEISKFNKEGLFIAAPKKHFDLSGLEHDKKRGFFTITKTVVKSDPIVFRYVKGNMVQVLTKWGLEANDPALVIEILN